MMPHHYRDVFSDFFEILRSKNCNLMEYFFTIPFRVVVYTLHSSICQPFWKQLYTFHPRDTAECHSY